MPAFEELWLLAAVPKDGPSRCLRKWHMSSFLSVGVSVGHGMPLLSSVFLGHLVGPDILRDTSYDLCSQELPRLRALVLCPENSEPNLAKAMGEMSQNLTQDFTWWSQGNLLRRGGFEMYLKAPIGIGQMRMTFQGSGKAYINMGT